MGEKDERAADELAIEKGRQPWNLVLGFTYTKNATGDPSSTLRVGWDFKLSDNWRVDYSTIYDIEARVRSGQYIGITPGGADEFLHDGSQIEFVQDAIVLENLISKYLFSQAGKENPAEKSTQE